MGSAKLNFIIHMRRSCGRVCACWNTRGRRSEPFVEYYYHYSPRKFGWPLIFAYSARIPRMDRRLADFQSSLRKQIKWIAVSGCRIVR
jgi:hypothetical protein